MFGVPQHITLKSERCSSAASHGGGGLDLMWGGGG